MRASSYLNMYFMVLCNLYRKPVNIQHISQNTSIVDHMPLLWGIPTTSPGKITSLSIAS